MMLDWTNGLNYYLWRESWDARLFMQEFVYDQLLTELPN